MSNILSEVHPELVAEWSDKNLPLTPYKITYGSNKVVWWKGACGHEWKTSVILPEHINCEGCRMNGVKTVFCDSLCGIRKCALKKGVTTCGDCPELEICPTVGAIIANNPAALENLKG